MIPFVCVLIFSIVLTGYGLWGAGLAVGCLMLAGLSELTWKGWALILTSIVVWVLLFESGYPFLINLWREL